MEYIVGLLEEVLLSTEKRFVKLNFHIVTRQKAYKKVIERQKISKRNTVKTTVVINIRDTLIKLNISLKT